MPAVRQGPEPSPPRFHLPRHSVNVPRSDLLLTGPTASGKTAVALEIARSMGGEIISADSMQVYRGMDIGTAKASRMEREQVRHHLIDLVDVSEPFDAARWLDLARQVHSEVIRRESIPIFCGGTGLYFKLWLDGIGDTALADPRLRSELEAMPLDALKEELRGGDPEVFARIDLRNPRRVVRAVELLRLTGRAQATRRRPGPASSSGAMVIVLRRAADDLRRRIEARVNEMFSAGLVEETRRLLHQGLESNRTAMQAIGYRQVTEHLLGARNLPETMDLVKQRTWQFARRQMTWFRHQLPVRWLDVCEADSVPMIAERVMELHAGTP